MTMNAEHNDQINAACDQVSEALQQDISSEQWLSDVLSATERLCAVMDLLRHKLDGLPLH